MTIMQVTYSELQEYLNGGVTTALRALEDEGLLKKPAAEILKEYAIVVQKKGCLGKVLEVIFKTEDNSFRMHYVKIV